MSPTKGKKYYRIQHNRQRDGGALPLVAGAKLATMLAPMTKAALAKSLAKVIAIVTAPAWVPALTYKAGKTIVKGTAKGTSAAVRGTHKLVTGKGTWVRGHHTRRNKYW
jgi:hypothetical protein